MSEQETEMETVTFHVPDNVRLEDRIMSTRFDSVDDFVMQLIDESHFIAQNVEEAEADDEVEIEVPKATVDEVEEMLDLFNDREYESVEDMLTFLFTQLDIQERFQYGGV